MKLFYFIVFIISFSAESATEKVLFLYDSDSSDFLVKKFKLTPAEVGAYQGPKALEISPENVLAKHVSLVTLLTQPNDGSEIKDENPKMICSQEIMEKARIVMEAATKENPSVIIGLGRGPNFLIETMRYLYAQKPNPSSPSVFSVAFSGSPDAMGRRDLKDPHNLESDCTPPLYNVLTLKREATFFAYLDSLKFKEISGKIWCIDFLGGGAGLNSFLRLLRKYYGDRMPEFRFWSMNTPVPDSGAGNWKYDCDKKILAFSPHLDWGLKPMEIPTYTLNMSINLCRNLDTKTITDLYGSVPEWEPWQMKARGIAGHTDPHAKGKYFDQFSKILISSIKFLQKISAETRALSKAERIKFYKKIGLQIGFSPDILTRLQPTIERMSLTNPYS